MVGSKEQTVFFFKIGHAAYQIKGTMRTLKCKQNFERIQTYRPWDGVKR